MLEITIRKATKADLPAVLALYVQPSFNDGRVVTLAQAEQTFEKFGEYPDYGMFLAEAGNEIVGTFCLMIIDNIAHWGMSSGLVEAVVVSETHKRSGIGKAMMIEARRLAEAKGCYKLALSSNVKATQAHDFYESLGFERYGFSFRMDPATGKGLEEVAA